MNLSKPLADGLNKLGWSFDSEAELNQQWVKDLGAGPVYKQGGPEWEVDFDTVQTELFKDCVGYKANALEI